MQANLLVQTMQTPIQRRRIPIRWPQTEVGSIHTKQPANPSPRGLFAKTPRSLIPPQARRGPSPSDPGARTSRPLPPPVARPPPFQTSKPLSRWCSATHWAASPSPAAPPFRQGRPRQRCRSFQAPPPLPRSAKANKGGGQEDGER